MAKIVHNPTPHPHACTVEGNMCFPGSFAFADDETAERQQAAGRLRIIDPDSIIDPGSDPVAIMVKQAVEQANAQESTPDEQPVADDSKATKAAKK